MVGGEGQCIFCAGQGMVCARFDPAGFQFPWWLEYGRDSYCSCNTRMEKPILREKLNFIASLSKGRITIKSPRIVSISVLLVVSNPVSANLKIRFLSNRDGSQSSLFVMNPDSSDPVNIMREMGLHRSPVWSPDRTKIAFDSHDQRESDIFVMDSDGSNLVNLSNKGGGDYSPCWSPDGTQVLWYGWPTTKVEGHDFYSHL